MWQRHLFAVLLLLGLLHVCLSAAASQPLKKEPSFAEQAEAQQFARWLLQESHLAKLMPINKPAKDPITADWVNSLPLAVCMQNTTSLLSERISRFGTPIWILICFCAHTYIHTLDSGIEEWTQKRASFRSPGASCDSSFSPWHLFASKAWRRTRQVSVKAKNKKTKLLILINLLLVGANLATMQDLGTAGLIIRAGTLCGSTIMIYCQLWETAGWQIWPCNTTKLQGSLKIKQVFAFQTLKPTNKGSSM